MRDTWPLLKTTDFPPLKRAELNILQVNLGYRCNQACLHCHVNAGPTRKEQMQQETIGAVIEFLRASEITTLDLTGGAPELNSHFCYLVENARELGKRVIDRCNLTILNEPGFEYLPGFLTQHQVEITASLPCYLESNVDGQRGEGVGRGHGRARRGRRGAGERDLRAGGGRGRPGAGQLQRAGPDRPFRRCRGVRARG